MKTEHVLRYVVYTRRHIMLSIIVGIMFIVGSLSGEVVYRGNNSGGTLALIGLGLVIWGMYRGLSWISKP